MHMPGMKHEFTRALLHPYRPNSASMNGATIIYLAAAETCFSLQNFRGEGRVTFRCPGGKGIRICQASLWSRRILQPMRRSEEPPRKSSVPTLQRKLEEDELYTLKRVKRVDFFELEAYTHLQKCRGGKEV